MFGNSQKTTDREQRQMERELFGLLEPSDHDIARAADSPFLARRLMVSIEAEKRRRSADMGRWALSFGIALRAIPAFAAIAIACLCLFWYTAQTGPAADANLDRVSRSDQTLLASSEVSLISSEDMVSIMLGMRPMESRGEQ